MKKLLALLAIITIGLSFQSCGTLTTNAQQIWSNPAIQAQLAAAEQMAIQFYHTWITTHLGASRNLKSPSTQSGMASARAAIKAKYPDMPDSVISNIVTAKFAGQ
jgi:hypothetical protein